MYTLFHSPGSCSLLVHALLQELDVPFELKRVDFAGREHHDEALLKVNPKAKVPALVTPDGVLTECVALVEHQCDRHGEEKLLRPPGSWERAQVLERIAALATGVYPLFNRFFHADGFADDRAARAAVKAHGAQRLSEWFAAQDAAFDGEYWSGPRPRAFAAEGIKPFG